MESKRKELLFITSRFPYPLDKGDKLRVFHQLKTLAEDFAIHLICINEKEISQIHYEVVSSFCESTHCYVLPKYKRIFSLVKSLWNNLPLQVAYFYNGKIHKAIRKKVIQINPDLIHCHLIRTTEYIRNMENIPTSLDFMDAFAIGMEKRAYNEPNPFKKLLFKYESRKLKTYENLALTYVDQHCIISKQDGDAILNPESKPITIIPNGVDVKQFYPKEQQKQYDLLFMGNMAYPPNIAAVKFILKEIMPLVIKERPKTTLLIAGIGIPASIKKYQNDNITTIEHFTDISDSIASSKIMLAPMLISIGFQNKIIQAMAMKVPCIVTPSSNRPIGAIPNNSIKEAQTASEFSFAILSLLREKKERDRIALNGYKFAIDQYSWPKQVELLKTLILS